MPAKERILIVDDNPESIWPLIEYLEPHYDVTYATSAEKAFSLACSAKRPDLILLDVVMPDMDGYQLFEKLRGESYTREIPVVFLTALSEFQEEVKGLEIGAQDYIIKPFSLPVVSARIRSVLNLKKELERRLILKTQLEEMNQQLERQVKIKMKEFNEAQATLRAYEEKYEYLFKHRTQQVQLKTVLVVDDNPENIYILAESLEREYKILYATSGSKALDIATSNNQPDIVLLDIMMPEMDGYEVCSRLKANAETWDIPVIFISALDQEIDETRGLNLGAVDFITKPFSLPVVKARLKAALRLKEEMDNRVVLTQKLEDLNKNLEKRVHEKTVALKKAHSSLMESEKRYRTLYETAIEGIFESTPDGQMLSASPSLARMLGYQSPEELISTVQDAAQQLYYTPEDRLRFTAELEKKGETVNYETRFVTKQGDIIWVLMCAKITRNERTNEKYYHGFIINITELKESQLNNIQHLKELRLLNKIIAASVIETSAESILATACAELSTTFRLTHAFALLIDKDQTQARVAAEHPSSPSVTNPSHQSLQDRIFSFQDYPLIAEFLLTQTHTVVDDVTGDKRLDKLVGELGKNKIKSILFSPLVSENQTTGCLILGGPEKTSFDNDNIRLVKSVTDQISGVLSRLTIEENRRQLEKQYFHAQRMEAIGTLSGGLAHDFNNILTVILSVCDLMKHKLTPNSELIGGLDQILTAGKRAANLVSQLLAFSRQQILQPKPININEVLREFEEMLSRVIGEDISLVTSYAPDLHFVKADRGQMEQVVMNLVINARDAMQRGGQLTIETENTVLDKTYSSQHLDVQPGDYIMIAVSDTGTGISPDILPHVFEPFFTTKPKEKGTGLGLASVHGIIKQSDGHIWVYSEVDQGTSFKIYLPKYEERVSGTDDIQTKTQTTATGGNETILLVENDITLMEVIRSTLEEIGYRVITADSAESATKIFTSQKDTIDLLLSDVVLPGDVNGLQLAQKLCEFSPQLRVLYMSGYTNKAILSQGISEVNMAFIQKPFQPKLLADKVREILDTV